MAVLCVTGVHCEGLGCMNAVTSHKRTRERINLTHIYSWNTFTHTGRNGFDLNIKVCWTAHLSPVCSFSLEWLLFCQFLVYNLIKKNSKMSKTTLCMCRFTCFHGIVVHLGTFFGGRQYYCSIVLRTLWCEIKWNINEHSERHSTDKKTCFFGARGFEHSYESAIQSES